MFPDSDESIPKARRSISAGFAISSHHVIIPHFYKLKIVLYYNPLQKKQAFNIKYISILKKCGFYPIYSIKVLEL
jgi:hypothetical protein